jgi:hypothetical protein
MHAQQYYEILAPLNAVYVPHPLRLGYRPQLFNTKRVPKGSFSWGGVIATCLEEGMMDRDPVSVATLVARISARVREEHLTWYDIADAGASHAKRLNIAQDLDIPVKFRARFLKLVEMGALTAAAGIDSAAGIPVTVPIVAAGTYRFQNAKETWIHGTPLRIPLLRQNFYFPGSDYWASKANQRET